MLITRIDLENIKSYRRTSIDLGRGTTAIGGANGSGKTTIVEAVGFALFDFLPYKQGQFIREGEKYGKVVVHLVGNDARPYEIERRCGSGAHWFVYDIEANDRLEQSKDVLDKLHDLFGIDRERPLDSLFRDALGVPQGTFTSIFLETASKRKQTFDALLQIEDYKTAADNLLETGRYYKEQMQIQEREIARLTFETRELPDWRVKLQEARQLDEQLKARNAEQRRLFNQYEEREAILNEQHTNLQILAQRYDASKQALQDAQRLLQVCEQQLQAARDAQQIVQANQQAYQSYEQANALLKQLRSQAQERDALRNQQAELQRALGKIEERIKNWQQRLDDVASARQKVVELAPLVERQVELEKQRDEAIQRVERRRTIINQGTRLKDQLTRNTQEQEKIQRKIAEIEPLRPVAELLQERNEAFTLLRIKASGQPLKQKQLEECRTRLSDRQRECEQIAGRLRELERRIKLIEEHRAEAEEMPVLEEQYTDLSSRKNRLVGNIEVYSDSRARSAGGLCPLLHERCLNIAQRGMASLESYFDDLLTRDSTQVKQIERDLVRVVERKKSVQKYADALNKLEQYNEQHNDLSERSQRVNREIAQLELEIADLVQDLQSLQLVAQQMSAAEADLSESKKAEAKVRQLDGLYKQVQQLHNQAQQLDEQMQELRNELDSLRGCEAQLQEVEATLQALNDPRSQNKAQLDTIGREPVYTRQLQAELQQQQAAQDQLHSLQEQLAVYASLDADIGHQEGIVQTCQEGHFKYVSNLKDAQQLSTREQSYQQQVTASKQAEATLAEVEQTYFAARDAFDESELETVKAEVKRLRDELSVLAERMQHHQFSINDLEQNIGRAEAFLIDLEAAQQEYQTQKDLYTMLESFRKLIKDAAPYILKAMLDDISAEANRIFGEVMGDRSAQLSWQNDYEITLRRQGVNRSFAQLSGGEQMSAALAVRLALLKKLSTLNIAFFDEPTQNMDELRRMNLAEQIRRVRGFDQLVVISHDDTFEQGLDGLVRLHKSDGETRLLSDDDTMRDQIIASLPM
jgi:exonuclease SbcC